MILLVHLLFGAAIGSLVKNVPLAITLAFLGHYLLDLIPHIDYPIKNSGENQWYKIILTSMKLSADLGTGILLIFLFSKNQPMIYLCGFIALIPDGLTALNYFFPTKTLGIHYNFHTKKLHFLKDKKISNVWRVVSQIFVVVISICLLKI